MSHRSTTHRNPRKARFRSAGRLATAGIRILSLLVLCAGVSLAEEEIEYNRDIRPILAENCFACHGPDSASRKADLRLDQRDAAIEAAAIIPGDAESSELIFRVEVDDPTMTDAAARSRRRP